MTRGPRPAYASAMLSLRYSICDVFTDRPLTGNALAVFTDVRDLSDANQQAIAREMNLSETVFLSRPQAGGLARLRIFTPTTELPFAGHPVLGAAFVIGASVSLDVLVLETRSGPVPVRLEREGARPVFGWMLQPTPTVEPFDATAALVAALGGVEPAAPVERFSVGGTEHVLFAVASVETLRALDPDQVALARLGAIGISVYARTGAGTFETRVFAPALGVNEDPATGSAAGPLAVHAGRHGLAEWGETLRIEQGAAVGRPSELFARASHDGAKVSEVEVGGRAVVIGRGELRFPWL